MRLYYGMLCIVFCLPLFGVCSIRLRIDELKMEKQLTDLVYAQCCGDNKCEFLFMELLLSHIVYVNSNKVMADMADERLSYK